MPVSISGLVTYFTNRVKNFTGGCLATHYKEWETLTSDVEILNTVKGLPLEFERSPPENSSFPKHQKFGHQESVLVQKELTKLIEKGAIRICHREAGEYISPIFLTPKSDGSFRLILNLKALNKHMPYVHFKMDNIHSVLHLIQQDCFMTSIDIKDAYYSVPIRSSDRKYLRFMFEGRLYEYLVLPNGLSCGPRKFTKLLKPALASLRKGGTTIAAYIDDILIIGRTYQECLLSTYISCSIFDRLGFVIHPDKSCFSPSKEISYLGFVINSERMTVTLTNDKKHKLKQLCTSVLQSKGLTIRKVAQLLGTITSSFPGVLYGPLHYRALETCKIRALKENKGNFDHSMFLTTGAKADICWWISNIGESFNVISHENPSVVLTTDASNTGWGAVTQSKSTSGSWASNESNAHINILELKAVLFGLQSLLDTVNNVTIKILSDNMTAVACINKMGTTHSQACNNVTQEIWEWAVMQQNWLIASHIPGIFNVEADKCSRENSLHTEWKLNELIFKEVIYHFSYIPNVDLFATRLNCQTDNFVSYLPDPKAFAVNAFMLNWRGLQFYAFPPFSCISRAIHKIICDNAKGIIVVPDWPNQVWYSCLHKILVAEPYIILPSRNQLYLPMKLDTLHPLWEKLQLLACLVHGECYKA